MSAGARPAAGPAWLTLELWLLGGCLVGLLVLLFLLGRAYRRVRERERDLAGQRRVLEMIVGEAPVEVSLAALIRLVEAQAPGMVGSVQAFDPVSRRIELSVAPGLPDSYGRQLIGLKAGPCVGSCGTAAYREEQVIVADIETDPLWADYRGLVSPLGLKACWSTPIFGASQELLGTFAMYYRVPRRPTPHHQRLIELSTSMAAVALQKRRGILERTRLSDRLRRTSATGGVGTWEWDTEARRFHLDRPLRELWPAGGERDGIGQDAFLQAVDPADRAAVQRGLQVIRSDAPGQELEFRVHASEGAVRWVMFRAEPGLGTSEPSRVVGVGLDVTPRRVAEMALRRREAQYRTVFEQCADGICVLEGGRFVAMNPAGCRMLGYTADEIIGLRDADVVAKADVGRIASAVALLREDQPVPSEWRLLRKDGSTFVCEASATQTADKRVAVFRDVTEARRIAEALSTSEQRLRLALEAAEMGVFEWEIAADRVSWSPDLEERWGLPPGALGRCLESFERWVLPEDLPAFQAERERSMATRTRMRYEFRSVQADGTVRWFLAVGTFRYDAAGKPLRLLGTMLDTSDQRRAEQESAEHQRMLSTLISNLPGAVYRRRNDAELSVEFFSEGITALSGYLPGEFRAQRQSWAGLMHPADAGGVVEQIAAAIEAGQPFELSYRIRTRDGTEKWAWERGRGVYDSAGQLLALEGFVTDITAQKRAELAMRRLNAELEMRIEARTQDLKTARDRAETADRLKSSFLATMSHELRTPLNSVLGFTGILLQELPGPLNAEQRKQLSMVQTSGRHLLSLINDVLDLSRIEAGQLELAWTVFDPRVVVAETVSSLEPFACEKGLRLTVDVAADVPKVQGDRRRLGQILLNLLNNAIKFTERGHVRLRVQRDGEQVAFSVEDEGCGIRPEHMGDLFKPFQQLDGGISRKHGGTGLGLSISQRLVEMLGGRIEVESTWQEGSTFTFWVLAPAGGRDAAVRAGRSQPAGSERP